MVAATPGLDFMPAPITLTLAMWWSESTFCAPTAAAWPSHTARASSSCVWGTVKEMSVTPPSDTFCTIMSTLMSASASWRNSPAATPGRSGTPDTVTLASDRSCTTARISAASMSGSSSVTQVPGSQVNADRTCNGTRWRWAYSTDRMAGFGQPAAVISSISSKEMRCMRRASGTTRGSVVNTPVTSV